jgi:hypothetical protein
MVGGGFRVRNAQEIDGDSPTNGIQLNFVIDNHIEREATSSEPQPTLTRIVTIASIDERLRLRADTC